MVRLWSERQRTTSSPPTLLFSAQVGPTTFILAVFVVKVTTKSKKTSGVEVTCSYSFFFFFFLVSRRRVSNDSSPHAPAPSCSVFMAYRSLWACTKHSCLRARANGISPQSLAEPMGGELRLSHLQYAWGMVLQMETNVCLLWMICGYPAVRGLKTPQVKRGVVED